jgi:signal recognition particle receptor subunit beta
MPQEYIVLVAGPMGAGKTTAIGALSEIPVVSTEAANTDTAAHAKALTTVALDYGEITLGDGDKVRLYGVPGQERFDFMWSILERRALGLMLLLDATADPVADLARFQRVFADLARRGALVVGVTRGDLASRDRLEAVHAALAAVAGQAVPVFVLDAREPAQMRTLLAALVALVEARAAFQPLQGALA